jgi:hypothetical protein
MPASGNTCGPVIARRPAEASGVAGAVAILVGYFAGIDYAGVLSALGVVVGFVPAAVTWIVTLVRKPKP